MPPTSLSTAFSVPAVFSNYLQLSCLNGMFRLTFCEQGLFSSAEDSPTPSEVIVPR